MIAKYPTASADGFTVENILDTKSFSQPYWMILLSKSISLKIEAAGSLSGFLLWNFWK